MRAIGLRAFLRGQIDHDEAKEEWRFVKPNEQDYYLRAVRAMDVFAAREKGEDLPP